MLSSLRETHLGFSTIFCIGMGRLFTRFGVAQHTVPICNMVNPSDGPSVTESVTFCDVYVLPVGLISCLQLLDCPGMLGWNCGAELGFVNHNLTSLLSF